MINISLQSFGDELEKISMSLDADTRNNMALRYGVRDYLPEGRLESNDSKETNFIPKLSSEVPESKWNKKRDELQEKYRKLRKPGSAAMRGAFGGLLVGNILTGGGLGGSGAARRLGYSGMAGLGAAAGLADHYAQKSYSHKKRKAAINKSAMVSPMNTFSPARAQARSNDVGTFHAKALHKGGQLNPPQVGKAFKLPDTTGAV